MSELRVNVVDNCDYCNEVLTLETRFSHVCPERSKAGEKRSRSRGAATDVAALNGTDEEVIGLLLLRQAVLTKSSPSHPHYEIFKASRDSAQQELEYRLAATTEASSDLLTEANKFIGKDKELRQACFQIPISINWMADKLSSFARPAIASAVKAERERIADELQELNDGFYNDEAAEEAMTRFIAQLRGEQHGQ